MDLPKSQGVLDFSPGIRCTRTSPTFSLSVRNTLQYARRKASGQRKLAGSKSARQEDETAWTHRYSFAYQPFLDSSLASVYAILNDVPTSRYVTETKSVDESSYGTIAGFNHESTTVR